MYYTFHVNDSGALEYEEEKLIKNSKSLVCKMYDDIEFNSLNDVLFSTYNEGIVINDKALELLQKLNLPDYELIKAFVKRKENFLGVKITKKYPYNYIKFGSTSFDRFYSWIDFKKSDVIVTKAKLEFKKLKSHNERLDFIKQNKNLDYSEGYSFKTNRIVFSECFDKSIDLFQIPFYSLGVYVSDRFRDKIRKNEISDIIFSKTRNDINEIWKPDFPEIEFSKKR